MWLWLAACAHRTDRDAFADLPEATETIAEVTPAAILERAAASTDPVTRADAVAALVTAADAPAGGPWGPRGLYDPDGWVERATVAALTARLPEPETAALLAAWVGWPVASPAARATAAWALLDRHLPVDASAAWRAEPADRGLPLALPAWSAGDADAGTALVDALTRGAIPLELDFIAALGARGDATWAPAARAGTALVDPWVAVPLAGARLALGDADADADLRRALSTEAGARAALDAVRGVPGALADGIVRRAQATGTDPVRAQAEVDWAARTAAGGAAIATWLDHDDRELRRIAASGLAAAAASDPDARWVARALARALVDPDPQVRASAARAVRILGRTDHIHALQDLLRDEREGVRVAAAAALIDAAP